MAGSVLVVGNPGAPTVEGVRRVAALAGAEVQLGSDRSAAAARWRTAVAVVVIASAAGLVEGLPRRPRLAVADDTSSAAGAPNAWQLAVRLGADDVFQPGADDRRLLDWLAMAGEPDRPPGPVVGFVAGCGGAGASTLAAALAVTAAESGPVTLIDGDPAAGGLDLVLGAEAVAGSRWPDLAGTRGVLRAEELAGALPVVAGIRLLSATRDGPTTLPADAMAAVVDAAARASDLVVLDLPPTPDAVITQVSAVVLVVPPTVRAVTAATVVLRSVRDRGPAVLLAVREPAPADLTPPLVADALALPLAAVVPTDPRLATYADRGRFVRGLARSPVSHAAATLLGAL